ncbi:MAG: hypothetical protein CM1200mP22_21620 [Dehalococcoidia bacterium]|nr:MAG: hypothetical protein CM1200mP22_21620 [Dehalococcoidia bacterium]
MGVANNSHGYPNRKRRRSCPELVRRSKANQPRVYPNLISIVYAAGQGEIDVGFVNHYYVPRFVKEEGPDFGARNHYLGKGDPGAVIDVAAVGIIKSTENQDTAERGLLNTC